MCHLAKSNRGRYFFRKIISRNSSWNLLLVARKEATPPQSSNTQTPLNYRLVTVGRLEVGKKRKHGEEGEENRGVRTPANGCPRPERRRRGRRGRRGRYVTPSSWQPTPAVTCRTQRGNLPMNYDHSPAIRQQQRPINIFNKCPSKTNTVSHAEILSASTDVRSACRRTHSRPATFRTSARPSSASIAADVALYLHLLPSELTSGRCRRIYRSRFPELTLANGHNEAT